MVLWRVRSLGIIDPGGVTPALDHWSECIPPLTRRGNAFAAIKSDGSVVAWGGAWFGGDSRAVAAELAGGVQSVTGNGGAFAAIKAHRAAGGAEKGG